MSRASSRWLNETVFGAGKDFVGKRGGVAELRIRLDDERLLDDVLEPH